jgi:formylglycine-generating enzyme required for sulfatase activity
MRRLFLIVSVFGVLSGACYETQREAPYATAPIPPTTKMTYRLADFDLRDGITIQEIHRRYGWSELDPPSGWRQYLTEYPLVDGGCIVIYLRTVERTVYAAEVRDRDGHVRVILPPRSRERDGGPSTRPATKPASRDEMSLALDAGVSLTLAEIPAGRFMMGSTVDDPNRQRAPDETQHEVVIARRFYIGVTEVTQEQYESVMRKNPSKLRGARLPVDSVSWQDAAAFCELLSKRTGKTVRLPTEAEWEYACRAGTTTIFNVGDWLTTADANFDSSEHTFGTGVQGSCGKTLPVGSFPPNVAEWCSDSYTFSPITQTDPVEVGHFTRGGSWRSLMIWCRTADRDLRFETTGADSVGFRIVVDP